MSQRDLARALRETRPVAPAGLRERVRMIAAESAPPRRSLVTWRRALVAAVPVAAAIVAGVLATRGSQPRHEVGLQRALPTLTPSLHRKAAYGAAADNAAAPAPSRTRVQRYSTSLQLRVRDGAQISDASKRAIAIARSLGGYEQSVEVDTSHATGYASIRLRVPKTRVQEAVRRLTTLGTIVSESVRVEDLTVQVNATDRLIARLQKRLADLRTHYQDTETQRQEAALETRIAKLQRGRTATVRTAHYATIDLQLTTRTPPQPQPVHHRHGPLHGLGVAFRWLGIGAVYALALGAPVVALAAIGWLLARGVRRRREDALLSRS
jgi:hypothetical protein